VPKRIAFLEIIRKLNEFDNEHLRKHKKGSFFPTSIKFNDFTIVNKDGLDKIDSILEAYMMDVEKPRVFDPEGFIDRVRVSVKRPCYIHQVLYDEDTVRNYFIVDEVHYLREKWEAVMIGESVRKNLNATYQEDYAKIED